MFNSFAKVLPESVQFVLVRPWCNANFSLPCIMKQPLAQDSRLMGIADWRSQLKLRLWPHLGLDPIASDQFSYWFDA